MTAICEADVKAVVGETDVLVLRELVRTKATADELARAVAFARNEPADARNAHWTLSSRVQRLIDLVSVTEFGDGEKRSAA